MSPASRVMGFASIPSQAQLTTSRILDTSNGAKLPSRLMTLISLLGVVAMDSDVDCIVNLLTHFYNNFMPYHCTLIPYLVTGIDKNLFFRYI